MTAAARSLLPDPRSPIGAIFYTHWLELRIPMLVTCAAVLLVGVGYGFAVTGTAGYFATTGKLTEEVARDEAIRQMGIGPALIPAALHALIAAFFGLWASASFVGTGFGATTSIGRDPSRHPSAYFTASLPLSRAEVVLSRLTAGFGSLLAVLGLSLAFHVIVLVIIRQPVPIIAMAGVTLMAAVGGLGLMSLVNLITVVASGTVSGLMSFGLVMALWLTDGGWERTVNFVWPRASALGAALLASAAITTLSIMLTRRRDL